MTGSLLLLNIQLSLPELGRYSSDNPSSVPEATVTRFQQQLVVLLTVCQVWHAQAKPSSWFLHTDDGTLLLPNPSAQRLMFLLVLQQVGGDTTQAGCTAFA
jgi:hypothetical protein